MQRALRVAELILACTLIGLLMLLMLPLMLKLMMQVQLGLQEGGIQHWTRVSPYLRLISSA